jgi:precorrin-3B synthase
MTESLRRGACPGLSAPMPTGDGLLARLTLAAPVLPAAMAGLCQAARLHGNGTIDVTARGSLQVRGLTPHSAPLFADAVGELGIAVQDGVRVVAGFDDGAVDLVAAALRRAIAAAPLALSPKVSVIVDGDGPLHLDGLAADVRLRVVGPDRGQPSSAPRFHLGIGGYGRHQGRASAARGDASAVSAWRGTIALKDAVGAVIGILAIIAAHGPAARAADFVTRDGAAALPAIAAVAPASAPPPRLPAEMIGLHPMRDGAMALGIGLVFGHTHAAALAALMGEAANHGVRTVRPAPDRALLLTGISALNARGLIAAAERLGFVVHADDPRRRIAACPGGPACASGLLPAREVASILVPALARLKPAPGVAVHVSGCAKGCAHPHPAALTLVGAPEGCGVVHHGTARDMPRRYVDPARLGDELPQIAAALAAAVATPEAVHG